MEKSEIKITDNHWPVIIKESDEGSIEAECPFFSDCKVEGSDENDALKKLEFKIKNKISDTRWIN